MATQPQCYYRYRFYYHYYYTTNTSIDFITGATTAANILVTLPQSCLKFQIILSQLYKRTLSIEPAGHTVSGNF